MAFAPNFGIIMIIEKFLARTLTRTPNRTRRCAEVSRGRV